MAKNALRCKSDVLRPFQEILIKIKRKCSRFLVEMKYNDGGESILWCFNTLIYLGRPGYNLVLLNKNIFRPKIIKVRFLRVFNSIIFWKCCHTSLPLQVFFRASSIIFAHSSSKGCSINRISGCCFY